MNSSHAHPPPSVSLLRVIRSSEQPRSPWKNGGGVTTEIAAYPAGASLDTFDWRVSTAQVAADGPFSLFPGIDRTLAIMDGAGLTLTVGLAPPTHVSSQSPPFTFAADQLTRATLIEGPVIDLNVMSKRGVWRHNVERIDITKRVSRAIQATTWLAYCREGRVGVSAGGQMSLLNSQDAAVGFAPQVEIEPGGPSTIYLIEFHRL